MTTTATVTGQQRAPLLPEAQLGPAERLLNIVLNAGYHLWHNRPGVNVGGVWQSAKGRPAGIPGLIPPGLFVPSAVSLYSQLLEIYKINPELAARFASYSILEGDWRDLKTACAALMLVQDKCGDPVRGDDGSVEFFDDDFRAVGQGMLLFYQKKSKRMMGPKSVLRVAQLLEKPEIATLNRQAGFGDRTARQPFLGRWPKAASNWLRVRERNLPMLKGIVNQGGKETIKLIARKCGYKPESAAFFELLGWPQKQSEGGHREVGLTNLNLVKRERFDGLTEEQICQRIVEQKLSYMEVTGRLPKEMGLTPAIMVACLPSLGDKDLRMLTPTLEELDLLKVPEIKARWDKAIEKATDQRSLNIAKNVKSKELKAKLEDASDNAVKKAVAKATQEADVHVIFLIDKSGSMTRAIDKAKDVLTKIMSGFPPDKLHIAAFDTMGTVLKPKAPTRAGVQKMLEPISAGGGTNLGCAIRALYQSGVRIPESAHLIVMAITDEAGEPGDTFAKHLRDCGYKVAAFGHIYVPGDPRRDSLRGAARILGVPYTEVDASQFDDVYQVPRVLQALLEAPVLAGAPEVRKVERISLVEKVMKTPLLGPDGNPVPVAKATA